MKRVLITCFLLAALLLGGLVVFRHLSSSQVEAINEVPASSNAPTSPDSESTSAVSQTNTAPIDPLAKMGITPDMTQKQREQKYLEWYASQASKMTERNRRPIAFYGQTVDESNQPVAGVNVHLILGESPATPDGIVETHLQTDANGAFSYADAIGHVLQVWLGKDGYYVPKSNRINFDFTSYQPNPFQPEVFHLRKKRPGVNLITSQYGVYRSVGVTAPRDGTPVYVDFFTRQVSSDGQLEISQKKPVLEQYRNAAEFEANVKEWSYRLAIPDGGLVETTEEFPFEAPLTGYQPVVEYNFQKGDTNWVERIDKTYYIAFGNPRKYGRIHVSTAISSGTSLEYAINPDGSQNLEPQ